MGLNSFMALHIMKEILIFQDIQMSNNLKSYKVSTDDIRRILTPDSYIDIETDGVMKQKMISHSSCYKIDHYYKNQPIFVNKIRFGSAPMHYIPYVHDVLNGLKNTYKLTNSSKVAFIEEIYNNGMDKYYFLVNGDEQNVMVKEDIISFLSMIK